MVLPKTPLPSLWRGLGPLIVLVLAVNIMLSKKNLKEKTYNLCLYCDHRGASCYGPHTSDMPIERWREFMRDMKEVEGLTYAEISKRTHDLGIPIPAKTIEKKLSPEGDGQDIMRETARAIELAILGSAPYPCYRAFLESTAANGAIPFCKTEIDNLHKHYQDEIQSIREDAQKKIEHLKDQIEYLRSINDRNARIIDRLMEK